MGEVEADGRALEVADKLDIFAVTIGPADGVESPAYDEARAAFEENGVVDVTPDEADRLAAAAADALARFSGASCVRPQQQAGGERPGARRRHGDLRVLDLTSLRLAAQLQAGLIEVAEAVQPAG